MKIPKLSIPLSFFFSKKELYFQAHAAAALVNFSEDCPKPILTQYLGPLMNKLEAILTAKFKEVKPFFFIIIILI